MQSQSPMPCPSDGPEEIVHEYINLDTMPDEALASLVEIELPNLTPRFGLMPDLASFVDGGPRTPACAPPPGLDALPDGEKLHWHVSWDRILQMLNEPVQAFTWRGDKRVFNVLRSWVLVFWADGRITPLRWRTRSCGVVRLTPAISNELNLAQLASEGGWLAVVSEGMKWELVHAHMQLGHAMTAQEPRTKNQQMFAAFRDSLLAQVRQMRLDSRIQSILGLDCAAVGHAQAAYGLKHHAGANEVTVVSYNWALSQFLELETLQRESPHLLPFYPLVANEVSLLTGHELTYQIKRLVTRAVGRFGWMLMLRHGRHLFVDVHERYGVNDAATWLDLLQLHSLLGGDAAAPRPLLDLVMRQFGNQFSQRRAYFAPVQKAQQAWAHFGDLWRKAPPANEREMDDWALVAGWIADPLGPSRFDACQRSLGFDHLVRKARAWEENRSAWVSVHNALLPVWHAAVSDSDWDLRFLKDRTAFWKEGTDMGHCLGRRGGPSLGLCKLFASVFFQGQHIGTALYTGQGDQWALAEAHGKYNQPLSAQQLRALRRLGKRICQPAYPCGGRR